MDEQSIFDILECSVCLERLDTSSRVLPCQHTFCMRCLQQILHTRGELRCPECRDLAPHQRVTDLPTNILLVRLLDSFKRPVPASPKLAGSTSGSHGLGGTKANGLGESTVGTRTATSKVPGPNQPCARALYNYEAQEPSDLSFNKGAIVSLLKRIDDNWYHGELDGGRGFFPASYVEVLNPLPPDPPQCKALYDFDVNEQEEKDCLTFMKDEVLSVIRRVDENWIEGQKGDKIGIFPISFVELNDTAKTLVVGATAGDPPRSGAGEGASSGGEATQGSSSSSSSGHDANSSKNKSSNKRHSFTSMLGVQLRSKESQDRGSGSGSGGGGGGGNGSSPGSNRHSMEISSPVLLRSSNPTAATLIEANKLAAAAAAAGVGAGGVAVGGVGAGAGSSPASASPSPSSSPLPAAAAATGVVVSGGGTQASAGGAGVAAGGRKKPAPLTLLNQPVSSGALPPNSPTVLASTGPGTPTLLTTQDPPASPKPKVEVFVAMFNYKPHNPDEIELRKGEFYTVSEKCKDGWFKGLSLSTGQLGVFPGNYMQVYRHDRTDKSKKASSSSSSSTSASSSTFASSSLTSSTASARSASSSSHAATSSSAQSGGKAPVLLSDGQKTVAQLQSERAAQRMHYQASSQTPAAMAAATPTSSTRPIQAPQARLSERHGRGSPPTTTMAAAAGGGAAAAMGTGPPLGGIAPGSWPGNTAPIQAGLQGRSGQVHTAMQTTTASQVVQTVRPRMGNASGPGSPPVSHGSRVQTACMASGVAEGVQPGVPVRQACSQMVPHQKEKKERKSKKPSAKHSANEAPELVGRTTSPSSKPPSPDSQGGVGEGASPPSGAGGGVDAARTEGGARGEASSSVEQPPPTTTPLVRERYRVIVPYPPTTDAELELKIGDTVLVHKKREDGWFKGTLLRTGKTGLFPGSFTEPY